MSGETARSESGWTVDTLRELVEQRFASMDKALDLKSEELSRRLDILNHAHERAVEVQHTYVPREVFEAFIERFDEYKETTNRALILREGQSRGVGLSANTVSVVLTLVVALVMALTALYVGLR